MYMLETNGLLAFFLQNGGQQNENGAEELSLSGSTTPGASWSGLLKAKG
jgi:hypothetical protein